MDHQGSAVSPCLRAAEEQIDAAHKNLDIVGLPYTEAVWYFLALCEEHMVLPLSRDVETGASPSTAEQTARADMVINHAKWPLHWLAGSCAPGGCRPSDFDGGKYDAAYRMSELGRDYLPFETAFTYASRGLLRLELSGRRIVAEGALPGDQRYDAYDRLCDMQNKICVALDPPDLITELVSPSVQVAGNRFRYSLNPRLVRKLLDWEAPAFARRFALPPGWRWTNQYTLGDYTAVLRVLWTISAIHIVARLEAATRGCDALGFVDALVVMRRDELVARVARYAGLSSRIAAAVVDDLTYGNLGQRVPDPALQPLVLLADDIYGWSPHLATTADLERNLVVLINRIPEGKEAYARLSNESEERLRQRLASELAGAGWRSWHGRVPGWAEDLDVDLALISDRDKECLCLELKSFISPAEPAEVIHRSEEVARGIEQVRERRARCEVEHDPLYEALGMGADYDVRWAVVSENSVGGAWVQVDDVPVVNAGHLVRRLKSSGSIAEVGKWMERREYLPVEGRDFTPATEDVTVAGWTLGWFGIVLHEETCEAEGN